MPFGHLCLRVRLPGGDRLADVGFGASFLHPLDLEATGPQADPAGTYQIVAVGDDAWDMMEDGEVQYRFFPRPRELADFAAACRFHQTSPESHFTQGPVCSLATADGRVTISGRTLITTVDGRRAEQVITSDDELLDRYRRHFGIVLDRVPLPRPDLDGEAT
jgi:N-hydroxyarylamine O-acetyltransferase